jgi:hypothetical protein
MIGVIVTYGNSIGKVRSIEKLFSIQSSFAWRLLFFFFLRSSYDPSDYEGIVKKLVAFVTKKGFDLEGQMTFAERYEEY